ncbi:MAG: hypothetical protein LBM92_03270 [Opitutaceae bacterium]|jgi:AAA+ ATPase superfamily predicted ATPase|nr:hypothetical protein [Opitutaceae bacterium]
MGHIQNPFLVSGYQGPEYFCDREGETAKIISALANDRNVTLISPRRIGKTGLIHHVFHRLRSQDKDIRCFYLDIFSTQNLGDFVLLLGQTVLGKLDTYSESLARRLSSFFKSFRPTFFFDPASGAPSVSLSIQPEQAETGLRELFDYLKQSGRRCHIAIDEFQQITEYPAKGVEALLRSHMQFLPNVKFIFAGSKKHLMDAMFSSASRPFYQSTQKINVGEIPLDTYRDFALGLFAAGGKRAGAGVFDHIYNLMLGHTWYVQFVCNQVYALPGAECSIADVDALVAGILREESATFKTYCEMITRGQLRLLRAIAAETKIAGPQEAAFARKHNLPAPSSIHTALRALLEKMLILRNEAGEYYVYDRFFSLWLKSPPPPLPQERGAHEGFH